jgi:hypothetical protein
LIHFDIRPDENGWTVYDRRTGEPAMIEGFASTTLARHDAEEIADPLNTLALIRHEPQRTQH